MTGARNGRKGRCWSRRGALGLGVAACTAALAGCGARRGGLLAGSRPKPLEQMGWEDIAGLAGRLAAAATDDEAAELAAAAGILEADGTLADQTKTLELKDGTAVKARVVGVRHDVRFDGSVKAGLTFLCAEAPLRAAFNGERTVQGGWEASGLYRLLAGPLRERLPDDLAGALVDVEKLSNNAGALRDASGLTRTTELLWVPSVPEVLGPVQWFQGVDAAAYDAVVSAGGTQYQWFRENLMTKKGGSPDPLAIACEGASAPWWYRTVVPTGGEDGRPRVFCVGPDGYAHEEADPTERLGVVFGFCL